MISPTDADRVKALGGDDLICVVGELAASSTPGPATTWCRPSGRQYGVHAGSERRRHFVRRMLRSRPGERGRPAATWRRACRRPSTTSRPGAGDDEVTTGVRPRLHGRQRRRPGAGRASDLGPDCWAERCPASTAEPDRQAASMLLGHGWRLADRRTRRGEVSVDDVADGADHSASVTSGSHSLDWDELRVRGRGGRRGARAPRPAAVGSAATGRSRCRHGRRRRQRVGAQPGPGSVDGGPGKDWLRVEASGTTALGLVADLERETSGSRAADRTRIAGLGARLLRRGDFARVNGTDDADAPGGVGLRQRPSAGRGGNDVLDGYAVRPRPTSGTRIEGGPGNDKLSGSVYRDRLIGGPGRDSATGGRWRRRLRRGDQGLLPLRQTGRRA